MPEWLKSQLAALGGGTLVLVGALTICKNLIVKLFETGIESSFEKSLEKFKNQLDRSTRAYEILLEREMRFYERMEPITATLVPLSHDFSYLIGNRSDIEYLELCEAFKKSIRKYGETLKELKSVALTHQTYIPNDIFSAASLIVAQMQEDILFWVETWKLLSAGKQDEISFDEVDQKREQLVGLIGQLNERIKDRLDQLIGN